MKKYRNSELCICKFKEIEKIISTIDSTTIYINLIHCEEGSKEFTEHTITECKPYK